MLQRYSRFVCALNERIGRFLALLLPVMTAVMLAIIFCSSVLRVGWVWMNELVVYQHAVVIMLGVAYTLQRSEHVCVDIFYGKLPPRAQAWVYLLGVFFLLLPVCAVIFVTSLPYVLESWRTFERSIERQGLPIVYLLKTCILIMPLLVALQGLALAAKSYLLLFGASASAGADGNGGNDNNAGGGENNEGV